MTPWKNQGAWNKTFQANPYQHSYRFSTDVRDAMVEGLRAQRDAQTYIEAPPPKRTNLSRVFDALLTPNYAIAGFFDGLADGRGGRTPLQGAWEGVKAGNPFGEGFQEGATTFTDVLDTLGWQPEGTVGKFARGTVGFGLDVLLDPTTYLTGGASAVIKGTGRVGKAATSLDKVLAKTGKEVQEQALVAMQHARDGDGIRRAVTNEMRDNAYAVRDAFVKSSEKGMSDDLSRHIIDMYIKDKNHIDVGSKVNILDKEGKIISTGLEEVTEVKKYKGELSYRIGDSDSFIPASRVVKDGAVFKTEKELADDAMNLANKYNEVMGFRSVRDDGRITWGIGNMPFAPKSIQDKVIDLGSARALREFGDLTGMSKVYAGARNFIYGSRLGRHFSNNSKLYALAHDDPAKLFEAMQYVSRIRGLNMDARQSHKAINEWFKEMDFTPAENKEIIRLLEDDSTFAPIMRDVRFAELEEVNEIKRALNTASERVSTEIDQLVAQREQLSKIQTNAPEDILEVTQGMEELTKRYEESLASLNVRHVEDLEKLSELSTTYQRELHNLRGKVYSQESDSGMLLKLADDMDAATKQMDSYMSEEINRIDTGDLNVKSESVESVFADELTKRMDSAPNQDATAKFLDAMGAYVFGDTHAFRGLGRGQAEELASMVRQGMDPWDIRMKVGDFSHVKGRSGQNKFYDPKFRTVYNHVASKLNYKNWSTDGFGAPARDLLERLDYEHPYGLSLDELSIGDLRFELKQVMENPKYSPADKGIAEELLKKAHERDLLLDKYGKLDTDSLNKAIAGEMDEELSKIADEIDASWAEEQRNKFYGSDRSRELETGKSTANTASELFERDYDRQLRRDITSKYIDRSLSENGYSTANFKDVIADIFASPDGIKPVILTQEARDIMNGYYKRMRAGNMKPEEYEKKIAEVASNDIKTQTTEELRDGTIRAMRSGTLSASESKDIAEAFQSLWVRRYLASQLEGMPLHELQMLNSKTINERALKESFGMAEERWLSFYDNPRTTRSSAPKKPITDNSRPDGVQLTRTGEEELREVMRMRKSREITEAKYQSMRKRIFEKYEMKNIEPTAENPYVIRSNDSAKLEYTDKGYIMNEMHRLGYINRSEFSQIDNFQLVMDSIIDSINAVSETKYGFPFKDLSAMKKSDVLEVSLYRGMKGAEVALERAKTRGAERRKRLAQRTYEDIQKRRERRRSVSDVFHEQDMGRVSEAEHTKLQEELAEVTNRITEVNAEYAKKKQEYTDFFNKRVADGEARKAQLEAEYAEFNRMKAELPDDIEGRVRKLNEYQELLSDDDALETWLRNKNQADVEALTGKTFDTLDVDTMLKRAGKVDTGMVYLQERASSERIEKSVEWLREKFMEMGEKEVQIGKLGKEQFATNMMKYFPRVLTQDGEAFFRSIKDVEARTGKPVTTDLGYGTKYNPYGRSRTAKGTLEEVNEYFNREFPELLKGKNVFSENVADVFLARATKHTELMYDDKYMREMLNVFGREIGPDFAIEEGYKAVANYGMLKNTAKNMASMETSLIISEDVSKYVSDNISNFHEVASREGMNLQAVLDREINKYVRDKYTDDVVQKLWENSHNSVLDSSGVPVKTLENEAMPMIEISQEQMKGLHENYDRISSAYIESLERRMVDTVIREADSLGDNAPKLRSLIDEANQTNRLLRVTRDTAPPQTVTELEEKLLNVRSEILEQTKRLEDGVGSDRIRDYITRRKNYDNYTPPQIRQVNDTIVEMANRSRQVQRFKDENRFLQVYDKFLHFMKLQQTTVLPSFHVRNKLGNLFNNWLAIGVDSFNKDWQIAATVLARHDGDMNQIKKIIDAGGVGSKQLSQPINIANPHPTLSEYIKGNQLDWTDMYELAVRYDVVDTGQFARDIGAGSASQGLLPGLRREMKDGRTISFDPTDTANFAGYKAGMNVGTVVENTDRMIHFMSMLRRGKSLQEAADSSKKYLFDYSDVTAFEENVMKRILPYYTWLRKNSRLQVSQLIENPGRYRDLGKAIINVEGMVDEEDRINTAYLDDWADDWIQLPFSSTGSQGQEKPWIMSANMPFMDISRLPDPTNLEKFPREILSQTAPMLKVPLELAMNRNSFFGSEIAREGESKLVEYPKHILSQFGVANVLSGFASKKGTDAALHAQNSLTGLKVSAVDYDRSRREYYEENPGGHKRKEGSNVVGDIIVDGIKYVGLVGKSALVGQPPMGPEDYGGALRPISVESYNKLSDEEKKQYQPPSEEVAMAYHREAIALAEEEYNNTGIFRRMTWALFGTPTKNEEVAVGYVSNIVDGDTIDVKIGDKEERVRLLLVDTPETTGDYADEPMPFGAEAVEHVEKRIFNKDAKLYIYGQDKYGRTLAFIETEEGEDLGRGLVEEGLGKVRFTYDNFPDTSSTYPRTGSYFDAQRGAYEDRAGIWSIPGYGGDYRTDSNYNNDAIDRYLRNLK